MSRQLALVSALFCLTSAACQDPRGTRLASPSAQQPLQSASAGGVTTMPGAGRPASPGQAPRFAPGQILVKLKPGVAAAGAASADPVTLLTARVPAFGAFRQRHGGVRAQRSLRGGSGPVVARAARSRRAPAGLVAQQLQDIFTVQVSDAGADPQALARELAADPAVQYAEPNHVSQSQLVPSDPSTASSGHTRRPRPRRPGTSSAAAAA